MIKRRGSTVAGGEFVDLHARDMGGWRNMLFINIFYDLLFDLPPTPDQLKESLNLLALITALLLTMVGALPYSGTDYQGHIAEVGTTLNYDKFIMTTTLSSMYTKCQRGDSGVGRQYRTTSSSTNAPPPRSIPSWVACANAQALASPIPGTTRVR